MGRPQLLLFCLGVLGAVLLCDCNHAAYGAAPFHDGNDAINSPDKFAWELFAEINRPAQDGTSDTFWETWATKDDLYHSPSGVPAFPSPDHRAFTLHTPVFLFDLKARGSNIAIGEEIRINRPTFDFIVQNNLWNQGGQTKRYESGAPIFFPKNSMEIKAEWTEIDPSHRSRFHCRNGADQKLYGLLGFHITSKDLPNWFWATFEQRENPYRCKVNGCSDTFGLDKSMNNPSSALIGLLQQHNVPPEWLNYRLTGTQTSFVDSAGRITYLGNSEIEGQDMASGGFMAHSSCITCHSQPRITAHGFQPRPFDGKPVGIPSPCWFFGMGQGPDGSVCGGSNATLLGLQADFVWSLVEAWRTLE